VLRESERAPEAKTRAMPEPYLPLPLLPYTAEASKNSASPRLDPSAAALERACQVMRKSEA